jgi:hypothetical protein
VPSHDRASRESPGRSVRQGAPGATSCSSAFRKAPRTFPHHRARGAGLPLHYQYRDCAALPNRPPGLAVSHRRSRAGARGSMRQGAPRATSYHEEHKRLYSSFRHPPLEKEERGFFGGFSNPPPPFAKEGGKRSSALSRAGIPPFPDESGFGAASAVLPFTLDTLVHFRHFRHFG